MASFTSGSREKPREWRRRVLIPARMRSAEGWGDARILNASSRGLMVHTWQPVSVGSVIELRRGTQLVVAKVVWREGPRAGLHSDTIIPLTGILCMNEALPHIAVPEAVPRATRRPASFDEDFYRARARFIEKASIALMVGSLAVAMSAILGRVAGSQLEIVRAALNN